MNYSTDQRTQRTILLNSLKTRYKENLISLYHVFGTLDEKIR